MICFHCISFPFYSPKSVCFSFTQFTSKGKREAQIDMMRSEQKTLQGNDITLDLITTEAHHMTSVQALSSRLIQHGLLFMQ